MIMMNQALLRRLSIFVLVFYVVFDVGVFVGEVQAETPGQNSPQNIATPNYSRQDFVEGNAMEISVYPDTSSFLNNVYPIDGDGYVYLPILGKVKITQMDKSGLRDFLISKYTEFLKFPNIQVRPLIRASILGGVAKPGLYYVDPANSFWHIVQIAGGTIDEDGLKKMRWKRNNEDVSGNLIPILQSGKSLEQIGFRSGDQIWIPTPNKPGFLDKISKFSGIISVGVTIYTLYYFTRTGRRAYY